MADRPARMKLRASGYASRIYERLYGSAGPWYDLVVSYGLLPLGGDAACRREFARWCAVAPGQRVLSLCCGTGRTERAIQAMVPDACIEAIDLGAGQIARARRLDRAGAIDFRQGDATRTGVDDGAYDRVLVGMCLHEMPAALRLRVLAEARRACSPDGRVIAIEHARPRRRRDRFMQGLWWLYWLPGNPEAVTSREMQRIGLDREMESVGLTVVERRTTKPDWIQGLIATRS